MTVPPDMQNPHQQRIALLRKAMQSERIDAYLVLSSDPHLSEYLPLHWQSRQWLSGFDGSAGTLLVTEHFAGLWTDSRYWVQAEEQLSGSGIELMRATSATRFAFIDWLEQYLSEGMTLAYDGMQVSLGLARKIREQLAPHGISIRHDKDLIKLVWPDRPPLPSEPVFAHEHAFTGLSRAEKMAAIRAEMKAKGADWHFISTLDDTTRPLNLRGSDVAYNPLFISHVLLGHEQGTLFISPEKVPPALRMSLENDGIMLMPYEAALPELEKLDRTQQVWIDPQRLTERFYNALTGKEKQIEAINAATLMKSRKTDLEIGHIRQTMEEDGRALCEFFSWLEEALEQGERITELTIAEKMAGYRQQRPHFVSLSFSTIAAFNENGALPHYHATGSAHSEIRGNGLLLIDSGGQYEGGTTDITRVIPIGTVSQDQKRDFTLVLKGLISLSRLRFPDGTRAAMLDAVARAPLWEQGIDYGHGTGHGIGYFLNVHEGPQSISYHASAEPSTAMLSGMITSIEPGIYRPGQWGVRIENLVLNQPSLKTEFGGFLEFETLTLCPIDTRCMAFSLFTEHELAWLNDYHEQVRTRLEKGLSERAKKWLHRRTQPVQVSQPV